MNKTVKRFAIALLACAGLLRPGPAPAQLERYVSPSGSHEYPYTNWATAATNLKVAVDAANSNEVRDVVWVADSRYILDETVVVSNAEVRGWSNIAREVIVDGGGNVRCFSLAHTNARLAGLTITNGYHANENGAGVYAGASRVVISNCVIAANNAALGICGGLYISNSYVQVQDTLITGNSGYGILVGGNYANFIGCTVSSNSSSGIIFGQVSCVISDCLLEGNGRHGAYQTSYGYLYVFNLKA